MAQPFLITSWHNLFLSHRGTSGTTFSYHIVAPFLITICFICLCRALIRVLARNLNLTTFLLNWEFSNPPLLSLPSQLPFPSLQTSFSNPSSFLLCSGRFWNNKGPTLAETHLPGQLAKSNDRKITCKMKQTLPLPVKCLYNKSLNEALI